MTSAKILKILSRAELDINLYRSWLRFTIKDGSLRWLTTKPKDLCLLSKIQSRSTSVSNSPQQGVKRTEHANFFFDIM